jgi:hypothetical protein
MDVKDVLCVSLGSCAVQLHDSLGSRRACACSEVRFSSLNGYHAWGLYYRRATFCCAFFCAQKDSMQRIFTNKYFLFTVGSVCRVKRFTIGSRDSLKYVRKLQMMQNQTRKWLRQVSKLFYAVGFDALVKRWDKCINVAGGYVEKEMFFPGSNLTFFYVLWPFVTYLLTLPRIKKIKYLIFEMKPDIMLQTCSCSVLLICPEGNKHGSGLFEKIVCSPNVFWQWKGRDLSQYNSFFWWRVVSRARIYVRVNGHNCRVRGEWNSS